MRTALAAAALLYTVRNFAMTTDTAELLSPELEWRRRDAAFDAAFPQHDDLIVAVIDGATPELAEAAWNKFLAINPAGRIPAIDDGGLTEKALHRLSDGALVESVLMRYTDRATICISSQAGCGMGTGHQRLFQQRLWHTLSGLAVRGGLLVDERADARQREIHDDDVRHELGE